MIGNYEAIMAIGQHAVTHGSCPIAETTYWNARAIHQWNQDFNSRIWPEPRIQWTGLQIAMLIKCLACNLQCLDWSDFADEICKTHRSAANAENRKILNKNFLLKNDLPGLLSNHNSSSATLFSWFQLILWFNMQSMHNGKRSPSMDFIEWHWTESFHWANFWWKKNCWTHQRGKTCCLIVISMQNGCIADCSQQFKDSKEFRNIEIYYFLCFVCRQSVGMTHLRVLKGTKGHPK